MLSIINKIGFLAIIALVGIGYWQQKTIEEQKADLNSLKLEKSILVKSFNDQSKTITTVKNDLENKIKINNSLSSEIARLNRENKEKAIKLNSYKGRLQNVVIKKPKIAEHIINNAVNKRMHQIQRITNSTE